MYDSVVNLGEWEGVAGKPATKTGTITYDAMATFDERQSDNAIAYIKAHAKTGKPFFHGHQLPQDAQPHQCRAGLPRQVSLGRLFGFPDGTRC